jgi:hypothetical protein
MQQKAPAVVSAHAAPSQIMQCRSAAAATAPVTYISTHKHVHFHYPCSATLSVAWSSLETFASSVISPHELPQVHFSRFCNVERRFISAFAAARVRLPRAEYERCELSAVPAAAAAAGFPRIAIFKTTYI